MSERRCPTCGALVTADAEWCSQCFASLVERTPAPPPPPARVPSPVPPPPVSVVSQPGQASIPATPGTVPGAPRPGTGPVWTCPVCAHENPLELSTCTVCGTPFTRLFQSENRPPVDTGSAVARSLAFPGLGHRLAGWGTDGFVRGGLFVFVLAMIGLLLLGRSGKPIGPVLPMIGILVLVALAIYVFSAMEARQLAQGGSLLVPRKTMTWVAAGLVVLVLLLSLLIVSTAVQNR